MLTYFAVVMAPLFVKVAYDENSHSVMKLKKPNGNLVLYMREINKYLALVCVMREESYNRAGVINYNFRHFRKAMSEVLSDRARRAFTVAKK